MGRFATRDVFKQGAAACPSAVTAPAGEKEPVLMRPWPLLVWGANGKAGFPVSLPAHFANFSRLAVV